jgi:hypothetical protein
LQADWALDHRDREQQRAKRERFRAMLDEQVHNTVEPLGYDDTPCARGHWHDMTASRTVAPARVLFDEQCQMPLLQVKAGHTTTAVMTKAERDINADLLRQQTKLAASK